MSTIRRAVASDASALTALAVAAYEPYVPRIGHAPAPMTADYAEAVEGGHTWVAEHGGRVAGFLVLVPYADHLLLENVAVHPDAQGTGLGGRLLRLAEDEARRLGLGEIRLYTNAAMTENLGYYPRHGYIETHRAHENGFDRVFFTKTLAP